MNITVPTETEVQEEVCDYIRLKHPEAVFNSDGAGNNLSPAQAAKNTALRSSSGYPDLFVAVARGGYHGLFLELKREGVKLHKKNGEWADEHVANQAAVLLKLEAAGYYCYFAIGRDQAIEIIDEYFALDEPHGK